MAQLQGHLRLGHLQHVLPTKGLHFKRDQLCMHFAPPCMGAECFDTHVVQRKNISEHVFSCWFSNPNLNSLSWSQSSLNLHLPLTELLRLRLNYRLTLNKQLNLDFEVKTRSFTLLARHNFSRTDTALTTFCSPWYGPDRVATLKLCDEFFLIFF